jgi:hypothetical protein
VGSRRHRLAGVHFGLQAGDIEQIGEFGQAVLARKPRQVGRQLGDVSRRLARTGLRWQVDVHVSLQFVAH